jgi:stearoyl-CoA desaturase (delta-9 desaturase)
MLDGLLDLSLWGYVLATLAMTHVTIAAVTIYLHRHQAHRALDLHPIVAHFFRAWLWLTTGMVTREWVAVHRKHHARCETADDPHSPQVLGIKKVLLEGAELYGAAAADPEMVAKYSHGTPDDWLDRRVYRPYRNIGVSLMLLIDLALFGVAGIAVWAVQMLWIPVLAAGVINGLGHYWGYRNFETKDAATNISPWGILIGGEELHNNHHAYASSAKLSSKWYEFDIGWLYIRILEVMKLARVRRVAPKAVLIPGKSKVDLDTLAAVITNHLQVMSQYAKRVVSQVYRDELDDASGGYKRALKHARSLLIRQENMLSDDGRKQLENVLRESQTLKTVYEYQRQLQAIWQQRTASHEKLLSALQEWCRQAEGTGIQALADFARSLRGYSLRPV